MCPSSQDSKMAPTATAASHAAQVSSSSSSSSPAQVTEAKTLIRGVYVPVLTFFHEDAEESLDLASFAKHVEFVAESGCAGVVVLGSTGERVALSEEERVQLIKTARETLDRKGHTEVPLIAGAGDQSIRHAIQSVQAAAQAGASHVLVLPSSYYPGQLGKKAVLDYYTALADASPIPILIYSYPGVSSGIVMCSETISQLALHPNIRGVKHTDHDIGKMSRHCAVADKDNRNFFVLGGASDYYIGALAVGAQGTITGMANIAPRAVVEIQRAWDAGQYEKARTLQHIVSVAEWELGKGGVPIHKALCQAVRGYGGSPRRPLQPSGQEAITQAIKGFSALMAVEKDLARSQVA